MTIPTNIKLIELALINSYKALSIANTLKSNTKYKSRIFSNINKLRAKKRNLLIQF